MARKPDFAKKEFITNVSTQLFAQRGYASTTIEQIARESGYAVGTIYLYFDSKEEILAAIMTEAVNEFTKKATKELDKVADPIARFTKIVELYIAEAQNNPDRAWVLSTELRTIIRNGLTDVRPEMEKMLLPMKNVVEGLQTAGLIETDVDALGYSTMVYGAIDNLALWWNMNRKSFDMLNFVSPLINTFLYGFATDKARSL
jgi:AcrR family transcriptional regulator